METQKTFRIVTEKNQFKSMFVWIMSLKSLVLPKEGCVFKFSTDRFAVTLYGNQFAFRSFERSARTFKPAHTIEM
jgi:RNase P/RNase MRP subunit p29